MQKIFFDLNSDQSLISLYNNIKTSDIGEDVKKKNAILAHSVDFATQGCLVY